MDARTFRRTRDFWDLAEFVQECASPRQLRLAAVGVVSVVARFRRLREETRAAIKLARAAADGMTRPDELQAADETARNALRQCHVPAFAVDADEYRLFENRYDLTALLAVEPEVCLGEVVSGVYGLLLSEHLHSSDGQKDLESFFCRTMRDIIGNPFSQERYRVAEALGSVDDVRSLAEQIYVSGEFGRVPELRKFVQSAGCTNRAILKHCRRELHTRGCWLIDSILGKPAPKAP